MILVEDVRLSCVHFQLVLPVQSKSYDALFLEWQLLSSMQIYIVPNIGLWGWLGARAMTTLAKSVDVEEIARRSNFSRKDRT